jgi:DNA polymerase-3 subunit alpha
MMKENYTVYVTAKVTKRFAYGDSLEIKVQQVDQLYDVKQRKLDKLTITMSADKLDDTFVSELTAMVNNNPGDTQFYIQLSEQGEEGTVSLTSANKKVDVNRQLLSFIQSNENIEYKIN